MSKRSRAGRRQVSTRTSSFLRSHLEQSDGLGSRIEWAVGGPGLVQPVSELQELGER
jgi:hypothetical protein